MSNSCDAESKGNVDSKKIYIIMEGIGKLTKSMGERSKNQKVNYIKQVDCHTSESLLVTQSSHSAQRDFARSQATLEQYKINNFLFSSEANFKCTGISINAMKMPLSIRCMLLKIIFAKMDQNLVGSR